MAAADFTVVFAPPLACTIPLRGSAFGWSSGPEPCGAFADWSAEDDDIGVPVADDGSALDCVADSVDLSDDSDEVVDDELGFDELESDDEVELVESGVADAIPGVLHTAAPMPSASASAPTRPMYLA